MNAVTLFHCFASERGVTGVTAFESVTDVTGVTGCYSYLRLSASGGRENVVGPWLWNIRMSGPDVFQQLDLADLNVPFERAPPAHMTDRLDL